MITRCIVAACLYAIFLWSPLVGAPPRPAQADDRTEAKKAPEEKIETLLANLEARCKKMIEVQIAVCAGSKDLHKIIEGHADKKPRAEGPATQAIEQEIIDTLKEMITPLR